MNTLNQILQNLYVYNGNKDAVYLKSQAGDWLVCQNNSNEFLSIDDIDCKIKNNLNNNAVKAIIYIYKDKEAYYLTNTVGEWFICSNENGSFVKIQDPDGTRTKNLIQDATIYDFKDEVLKSKKPPLIDKKPPIVEDKKPEIPKTPEKKVTFETNQSSSSSNVSSPRHEISVSSNGTKKAFLAIAILLLLGLLFYFLFPMLKAKERIVTKEVIKTITKTDTITVTKTDTVYFKEIDKLEENFNAVQFSVGKADLPEEAKFALYDLAKILEKYSSVNLKVEGHTSDEGNVNFNQKLSENRAKSVIDFLISRGISDTRLTFEGKGSSTPIDLKNKEKNRRTEFVIIK
jgi:outer membrane protein OmpA-like peptidoglycan-associated protein